MSSQAWPVVGIVAVVFVIAALIGSTLNSGDDDTRAPSATVDARQTLYDAFLRQARSDVRALDPEIVCEPDYWLLVAEQVDGATGGDRAILQHAMADACHEAGHLPGATNYSPYHRD